MLLNSCVQLDLCRLALVVKFQQNWGLAVAKFEIERGIELTMKEPHVIAKPVGKGPGWRPGV